MSKCESPSCKFRVHTKETNNDGKHCCRMCKRKDSKHGPRCERVEYTAAPASAPAPAPAPSPAPAPAQ